MPSVLSRYTSEPIHLDSSDTSVYDPPHRVSTETSSHPTIAKGLMNGLPIESSGGIKRVEGVFLGESNGVNSSLQSLPNVTSCDNTDSRGKTHSRNGSKNSMVNGYGATGEGETQGLPINNPPSRMNSVDHTYQSEHANGNAAYVPRPKSPESGQLGKGHYHKGHARGHSLSAPQTANFVSTYSNDIEASPSTSQASWTPQDIPQNLKTRLSSTLTPPNTNQSLAGSSTSSLHPSAPRLHQRHTTLEVPRLSTSRTSRDFSLPNTASDGGSESGRFSPTARTPRVSNTLVRAPTRSVHSDMYLDEVPLDGDVARWTETIRQKRASRRQRKEEEEDDRVVVGTKVDMNHVNWVTAYNMLTGIRFTVSRTNAKIDRDLADGDFDAKHKFSFDITGNELTPSAKYDFKFKDYAPWVFRHLRANFKLDPADYLMSLTSKYILSELGSPGKSGSFFYFSRDYKYIIKTIHHAEHKLLRKILREYYAHVERYPNTLISQFYGLHRVKIPYGRKIHFVVMNNLFPPHRDIHQTFDLKGSTIGRNYKEEDLERNPRATLKDLNWLRRNNHFEFGAEKKSLFIEQMKRDVALLQKLKIMDYSLLVGIHDLEKGNEENLRDKTLQVFQPGGDGTPEPQANMLTRTPSKLENARQARQLRQIIKKEKPVPMDKSTSKMPDEMLEERKNFIFYSDDGGFRATHENGQPGEEIYYLGIIDCLTHYGFIKRAEHFWKGLSSDSSQISPIPPEGYGDRFVKFISGITMTKEEQERQAQSGDILDGSVDTHRQTSFPISRHSTDKVMEKAEKQAHRTEKEGATEDPKRDRTLSTVRSPSVERAGGGGGATLPVVEEDGEAASRDDSIHNGKKGGSVPDGVPSTDEQPPPTPSKEGMRLTSDKRLPSLPNFNRLSMGLSTTAPAARKL